MMKMASLFQSVSLGRGVFVLTLALSVVAAVSVSLAQELLPELAAPAAQHKAADEALDKQKLEAIALAAKSYVSALDSIEKSATAKGEIDLVAAVVKEREAVAAGALEPDLPAALPKARLQMSRKTLLASLERINTDFVKRKKKADADYLRVLATFQTKAAANPELAKQLAAEKAALLQGGAGSGGSVSGGAAAKVSSGKNAVVNGDFEKIGADGKPEGWEKVECVTAETENGNTFVRFEDIAAKNDVLADSRCFWRRIEIPNGAKEVVVSARIRAKACVSPSKEATPRVSVSFKDQEGTVLEYTNAYWDKNNGSWRAIRQGRAIPKGASTASVVVTHGFCPGQIDIDDIEVTFK